MYRTDLFGGTKQTVLEFSVRSNRVHPYSFLHMEIFLPPTWAQVRSTTNVLDSMAVNKSIISILILKSPSA